MVGVFAVGCGPRLRLINTIHPQIRLQLWRSLLELEDAGIQGDFIFVLASWMNFLGGGGGDVLQYSHFERMEREDKC